MGWGCRPAHISEEPPIATCAAAVFTCALRAGYDANQGHFGGKCWQHGCEVMAQVMISQSLYPKIKKMKTNTGNLK